MKRLFLGIVIVGVLAVAASPSQAQGQKKVVTLWSGTESLTGYGPLDFELHTGGMAVMIDAKETVSGYYKHVGANITITIPGRAVYYGTIKGKSIVGTARDSRRSWTFSVEFMGKK